MSQIDNLQILINTLQNVKEEEIKREKEEQALHSRLIHLENEINRQNCFIEQLHSLTEKFMDHVL